MKMNKNFEQRAALAWAAGVFEGEGCISSKQGRIASPKRYPILQLEMTDEDVVWRVASIFKVGKVYSWNRPSANGRLRSWVWRIGRKTEVISVLIQILPFLGKRRKARAEQILRGDYRTIKETLDAQPSNIV